MFERFTRQCRDAVTLALAEAGRRGDRKVGTGHLLYGTLHDPEAARALGAGAEDVRRIEDRLDRDALAAVGVDLQDFGPLAPAVGALHLPLTPGAKTALKRALGHAVQEKSRTIGTRHLLSALRECAGTEPAAVILDRLHGREGS
ncbi:MULTISPECIES: Clp protease N-terminal domain-containing protein [Arthrobacter]|uniref:Clp protease N-terminal domain-containing protein n=2 Tax=Arthrobacter TaxID=1663 RepID=A0ABU9KPI4_9MICC|nr:Clp protease N-terminal domain-containing protein [Arthrobacter sp. YJM1]MDP5227412.1 Clp protease N-terminal domain-containing protein [Arthrobacter sp. YJM1]